MPAAEAATILVVDDDADIRDLVCEALDLEGYQVRGAQDGCAALALLATLRPDLILLDLNMPRMDGWTFCEQQREQPAISAIPVALMSAARNIRSRQLPCEPVAIFEKPFDLNELLTRVADALVRA